MSSPADEDEENRLIASTISSAVSFSLGFIASFTVFTFSLSLLALVLETIFMFISKRWNRNAPQIEIERHRQIDRERERERKSRRERCRETDRQTDRQRMK